MVVRNVVRSPVRAVVQSVFGEGESFHPFQLFTSGAQGAWYDPSDFSTLYQDANGTTPVTAVEQPVRLMLDRSRGLVLGSELRGSGTLSTIGTVTVGAYDTGTGSGTVNRGATVNDQSFVALTGLTAQSSYRVSFTVTSGSVALRIGNSSALPVGVFTGATDMILQMGASTQISVTTNGNNSSTTFTGLSVRELPGNHALAPNDASRPVLRARYNLLTRTEEFDDAAWTKSRTTITANAGVAPDGTTTADKLVEDTATGTHRIFVLTAKAASALQYTYSVYLKAAERTFAQIKIADGTESDSAALNINLSTGAISGPSESGFTGASATITALANGWYRVTLTATTDTDTNISVFVFVASALGTVNYTGDGTSGIYVWGAQLLTAADAAATGNAYQRVGAATDYDTGPPWRPYLAFDGSDDSMSTSSIDFSGTDKMTVFAGVKQQSPNTNSGQIIELSADVGLNNGAFGLAWPANTDINTLRFQVRGTTFVGVNDAAATTQTNTVISMQADISAPSIVGRRNGTQVASSSSSLGTGNFGNYPLFIGRRNNTSNPFNGRLYGLTVLGRTATAPELSAMESWIAGKTGVNL